MKPTSRCLGWISFGSLLFVVILFLYTGCETEPSGQSGRNAAEFADLNAQPQFETPASVTSPAAPESEAIVKAREEMRRKLAEAQTPTAPVKPVKISPALAGSDAKVEKEKLEIKKHEELMAKLRADQAGKTEKERAQAEKLLARDRAERAAQIAKEEQAAKQREKILATERADAEKLSAKQQADQAAQSEKEKLEARKQEEALAKERAEAEKLLAQERAGNMVQSPKAADEPVHVAAPKAQVYPNHAEPKKTSTAFPGDYAAINAAARRGNWEAQNSLGEYYLRSPHEKDLEVARNWFVVSADQGYAPAQYNIGLIYWRGMGVKVNEREALKWFHKAAEQNYAPAFTVLGVAYRTGRYYPQNYKEALHWLRKAAERDDAEAEYQLGVFYDDGHEFQADRAEAYKWFVLAATHEHLLAIKARNNIMGKLTREQIEDGQRRATAWAAKVVASSKP